MVATDPLKIALVVSMASLLLVMLIAEKNRPARQFPVCRGWIALGIGVMLLFIALANGWALLVLPTMWLREHRLINGEWLGIAGGIMLWYPINTFVTYWYHRWQHHSRFAWRLLHQVHHGVVRVDIPSAMMAHPFDAIVSATVSILVTTIALGLDPRAVTITGGMQFFMTLVTHWNVRTPTWLGYFVQRPEEHILHHQRGVHGGNYSDWPFWDKVFGTYRAPVEELVQVSFEKAGFSEQLKMLAFVDVNAAAYAKLRSVEASPGASNACS